MPEDVSRSEGFFGERVASVYDERAVDMFAPAVVTPVVELLADLAGEGAALEFGIGTGRIALPLAERGVRVHGIDDSEAMVARLRTKPGSEDIDVTIGSFATTRVDGKFSLVYLVFNTIFNLVTQDGQVACFQNAAAHLSRGGRFVIETGVPGPAKPPARPDHHSVPRGSRRKVLRRLRRRHAAVQLPALRLRRRRSPDASRRAALRMAVRARPDGAPRWDDPAEPLGRVAAGAIHKPQRRARFRLREAVIATALAWPAVGGGRN